MPRISNPNGPRMRPASQGVTAAAAFLRNASRDEVLFLSQTIVRADEAKHDEVALVRLAIVVGLEPKYGEDLRALRDRIVWRAKWFYRIAPAAGEPPVVIRWWARLLFKLPEAWRPRVGRFVDWCRGMRPKK